MYKRSKTKYDLEQEKSEMKTFLLFIIAFLNPNSI